MNTSLQRLKRVAIIGTGVAGLAAAWHLRNRTDLTVYEADSRPGGHANTVDVCIDGKNFGVDTGFLVCNHQTYPGLMSLFQEIEVALTPAEMGFSVQVRPEGGRSALEWAGTGLKGLLAQPSKVLSPGFIKMIVDIFRFNRMATNIAIGGELTEMTTGHFLKRHGFSENFTDHYLVPMVACIWSCSTKQMMDFPVDTLIRFCHNHGLLQVIGQPQWYSVRGGSRNYVEQILRQIPPIRFDSPVESIEHHDKGVDVMTIAGKETFDAVVLATHSDQALKILGNQATSLQSEVLKSIQYQPNRAVLHTDESMMPERRSAWAAWNFETHQSGGSSQINAKEPRVCLHYWLNALQELPTQKPIFVSLNPLREPDSRAVIKEFDYSHPIFDQDAIEGQRRLAALDAESVHSHVWFAGAWRRYGFHEDGYQSGLAAANSILNNLVQSPVLKKAA